MTKIEPSGAGNVSAPTTFEKGLGMGLSE